jgi:murein DD-endopeptidase MepM/ murein hydrolase activator NlpD
LELNASKSDYDWQKPLDGSGVAVDTSNWTKEFFQENGTWKVRFSTSSSLPQPITGPLTVVREGSFFDVNYNNGVTRYVNGVDQWRQHLGTDFKAAANTPVVSISAGTAVYCTTKLDDPFNSAVIVQQPNGVQVVYGHIKSALAMNATTGNCGTVEVNQYLGYVQPLNGLSSNYIPHVHMGYNTMGLALPAYTANGVWGWGRAPYSTTRTDAENRGWVDINTFYNAPMQQ